MTTTQLHTTVAKTEKETAQMAQRQPVDRQPIVNPVCDIHEHTEFIALYVELPGVSQDDLEITIDKDQLLMEAKASIETATEMKPTYTEFQPAHFKRSFTLSDALDTEQVEAKLTHGILELKIPRKELNKPRKVEIKVA